MPEDDEEEDETAEAIEKGYGGIIKEIAETDADVVLAELNRTIRERGISPFVKEGFLPYAAASAVLAFSGREIDDINIKKMLQAAKLQIDPKMLGYVKELKYKNHLPYINVLYFLLSIGKDPTADLVTDLVKAMGVKANHDLSEEVMLIYHVKIKSRFF